MAPEVRQRRFEDLRSFYLDATLSVNLCPVEKYRAFSSHRNYSEVMFRSERASFRASRGWIMKPYRENIRLRRTDEGGDEMMRVRENKGLLIAFMVFSCAAR